MQIHNANEDGTNRVKVTTLGGNEREVAVYEDGDIYIKMENDDGYIDIKISRSEVISVIENVTTHDGYFAAETNTDALARDIAEAEVTD